MHKRQRRLSKGKGAFLFLELSFLYENSFSGVAKVLCSIKLDASAASGCADLKTHRIHRQWKTYNSTNKTISGG
jgi:hypothetical protein